jgi:rare lipoprotein A
MVRVFAVVLGAASLAACAQTSVVTGRLEPGSTSRQASLQDQPRHVFKTSKRVMLARRHVPVKPDTKTGEAKTASQGVASFYTEGTQTASGEKFDTHDLTAAHPSLPFGTRLRVTNVTTGRSVTVRVNDRGPFVHGRVVDVSYSAAEALGMVDSGTAKVKLDVVQ